MSIREIDLLLKEVYSDINYAGKALSKASQLSGEDFASSKHAKGIKDLQIILQEFQKKLSEEIGVDKKHHTVLSYLKKLLKEEYEGVFTYYSHSQQIKNNEVASIFSKFFSDEAEHAEIFFKEIRKLGGIPKIQISNIPFAEGIELEEIINTHEKGEREAIQLLEEAKYNINDPYYTKLFEKIIAEEKEHLKTLSELRAKWCTMERKKILAGKPTRN